MFQFSCFSTVDHGRCLKYSVDVERTQSDSDDRRHSLTGYVFDVVGALHQDQFASAERKLKISLTKNNHRINWHNYDELGPEQSTPIH